MNYSNGLKIKWVDVDSETCNINLNDLKEKITEKTKALIFVHWGGSPVDLGKVKEIQQYTEEKFGFKLQVIEDSAHAFGAEYNGSKIGTHGNIGVFSLQAIKHLTTGDGGLIFLPNRELYERAKLLRWYGIDREKRSNGKDFRMESDIPEWGYKFHMNDINATIGLSNLPYMNGNLEKIRDNAKFYDRELSGLNGVEICLQVPNSVSAYWLYTIKIKNKIKFIEFMKNKNIMVSQVHNRNDKHSCVKDFQVQLPVLDRIEDKIVCIPVGWWITEIDRKYIVECVSEFVGNL